MLIILSENLITTQNKNQIVLLAARWQASFIHLLSEKKKDAFSYS